MARMTHELHNKAHEQAPLLVPGGGATQEPSQEMMIAVEDPFIAPMQLTSSFGLVSGAISYCRVPLL